MPKPSPLYKEAIKIAEQIFGAEDPNTAISLDDLAELYREMGEYDKAEPLLKEALRIRQKVLGQKNPQTAINLNDLAAVIS